MNTVEQILADFTGELDARGVGEPERTHLISAWFQEAWKIVGGRSNGTD